jgi:long-subunit acyl-CoA synthetase (AMP-forming)
MSSPGLKPNRDGDKVVVVLQNEQEEINERIATLVLSCVKLGITYTVLDATARHVEDIDWAIICPVLIVSSDTYPNKSVTINQILSQLEGPRKVPLWRMQDLWASSRINNIDAKKSIPVFDSDMVDEFDEVPELPSVERTVAIFFTAGSQGSPKGVRVATRYPIAQFI